MLIHPSGRAERLTALRAQVFDLLVIGGGITGCGIARDAALRGLTVALVEKDDFASGTSSRSSRLIHGGVRYLEHGQLHLVFESSAERRRLLRLAPHLVRPLAFTWPVYAGSRIPRWKLSAGLLLYDALALFRNVGRHQRLSRDAVLQAEPMLGQHGLTGGARYFDAATNDARLTLANALAASELGAVVVNHAAVTDLLVHGGRVTGATVHDTLGDRVVEVRAAVVVNATGPWTDSIRTLNGDNPGSVRGSVGAHIALPRARVGNREAVTLTSPRDGRVFFVLPAGAQSIVGTTDTYTSRSPDDVRATNEDVRYLLDSANAFFPAAALAPRDVECAWAGIRPLLPAPGEGPGSASREHAITVSDTGLISITGGKLTTYRVMAADVVNEVLERLRRTSPPDRSNGTPLPGGDFTSFTSLVSDAARATHDPALAQHLVNAYGTRWPGVWAEIDTPGGRSAVEDGLPYTIGELRYCARHEMADTLADLMIRRTHLAFETRNHGVDRAEAVASALGWSSQTLRRAVDQYGAEADRIFAIDA